MVERILELPSTKEYLNSLDNKAYDLLYFWKDHKDIKNDELLAKKYQEKVTTVRSILNKLSYHGIVEYEKAKDKNSGWYHYYWKINFKKLASIIYNKHKESKEKIKSKIALGQEYDVFSCKNKCALLPFEIAAEYNFVCPHCNETLQHYNYKNEIKNMKNYLLNIEKEMVIIEKLFSK